MDGVLKGFFVVGMVLLVGYILARTNALGPHGTKVLSTLTFMVGLPSLMFSTIASRHISEVLSQTGLISVVTALCCMALFALSGAIGRWGVRRTTIGALATGIVNSTNLGVPLSLYILGSATFVTPIMLFQLALVTPVALTILDLTDPDGKRTSVWSILSTPLRNPVTVAAILGVIVSAAGIELPALALDPLKLVAQLTVPLMLIIFGMSLHGLSPRQDSVDRVPTLFAVVLKSAVQPATRLAAGRVCVPPRYLQHLRGHGLRDPSHRAERGPLRSPVRRGPESCAIHGRDYLGFGHPPASGGGLAVWLSPAQLLTAAAFPE